MAVILTVLGLYFLLGLLSGGRFVTGTLDGVVTDVVRVSGLNPWLVKGVAIIVTIPFFWAVAKYSKAWYGYGAVGASLDLYVNRYGIIIVLYVGAFFLTMFWASRGSFYDTTGKHLKWCSETPEGIRVFDVEGVDPVYGVPLRPCTSEQVRAIRKEEVGLRGPSRVTVADPRTYEFFDGVSGRPRVWYYRDPGAAYELYDGPGTHPRTGSQLTPVSAATIGDLVRLHDQQVAEAERAQQHQAAEAEARAAEEFLARYLNRLSVNQAGRADVALFVNGASLADDARSAILEGIRTQGASPVEGLFRPAFGQDGMARALAADDWSAVSSLRLAERVDALLIVEPRLAVAPNREFDGVSTADLSLEMACVQVVQRRSCGRRTVSARGAGLSEGAAAQNAGEKVRPALLSALAEMRF